MLPSVSKKGAASPSSDSVTGEDWDDESEDALADEDEDSDESLPELPHGLPLPPPAPSDALSEEEVVVTAAHRFLFLETQGLDIIEALALLNPKSQS